MQCEESEHFIRECKLLSVIQPQITNVAAAETAKKTTKTEENSEKEQLLAEVTAESVQDVIRAERSLRTR